MSRSSGIESLPDYFDTEYRDYERQNPARKLDHYLDVIDRHAGHPGDLLDIGCGRGAFLDRVAFRHLDWLIHGTDINAQGLEATQARVPQAHLTLSGADLQSHPDGSLGVITAWDVVEHVDSLENVASAVKGMLRPNGVFGFVVPVYDGPLGFVVGWLDHDPTHVHKEGRDFWLEWARKHFEVLEWHGIFRYLIGGHYIHLPTRRLRRQATAILVVCRRPPHI